MTRIVTYALASTDDELGQIIDLQAKNLAENITADTRQSQGFVTVKHSFDLLKKMNASAQQIIAKDGNNVIGYALVMRPELRSAVPVLVPMFNMFSKIDYLGKPLVSYRYYVMGQICVGEGYRGRGVFDGLYEKHRQVYSQEYDLCITEISRNNERSMRAHLRVGFNILYSFRDATDEWDIVVWDFMRA